MSTKSERYGLKEGAFYAQLSGDSCIIQVTHECVHVLGRYDVIPFWVFQSEMIQGRAKILSPVPPYIEPGEGEITLVNQKAQ